MTTEWISALDANRPTWSDIEIDGLAIEMMLSDGSVIAGTLELEDTMTGEVDGALEDIPVWKFTNSTGVQVFLSDMKCWRPR